MKDQLVEYAEARFWEQTEEEPPVLDYLWFWFLCLHAKRENGMGIGVISHVAIKAWSDLYGMNIGPWEVSVIDALDAKWREVQAAKTDGADKKTSIHDTAEDGRGLKAAIVAQKKRRGQKSG